MKKLLVFSSICMCAMGEAQTVKDSVVMTVAGRQIPFSEFAFIAEKNKEVDLSNSKSLKTYVELFKNFKLKVAEGESLGLDNTPEFKEELQVYHSQLVSGYLSDKAAEQAAARKVYDRGEEVLELSHILFRLKGNVTSKDTVPVYEKAMQLYRQIKEGNKSFDAVGQEVGDQDRSVVSYEQVYSLLPMQTLNAFETVAYDLPVGEVSLPVRTNMGFHLILIKKRRPNPGRVRVAHILLAYPKDSVANAEELTRARAVDVLAQAKAGADFAELAKKYSDDNGSASNGGELSPIGAGEMVDAFEVAAFQLTTPGQLSEVVKTRFGYHIIKLEERLARIPFETEKKALIRTMSQGERNFELCRTFDERMQKEYNYQFYPEAYAELQALCYDHFPTDSAFQAKAQGMNKVLFRANNKEVTQREFAQYMVVCPYSTKIYAGDFMQEIYELFLREQLTTVERDNLLVKHPEFNLLMKEYRDGMLLFEVSNREVWSKPADQQKALEEAWIKSLTQKYPVVINWKLINKVKK